MQTSKRRFRKTARSLRNRILKQPETVEHMEAAAAAEGAHTAKKARVPPSTPAPTPDPESFARSYQLEALERAVKQNTIVYLETGSGKTLIAVMLIRNYAHYIRKPSDHIAVLLVPTVVLVGQQADVIERHTDLKVGRFWGDMGVDLWSHSTWKEKLQSYEVFVMTPQILLNNLSHAIFHLDKIKLLMFDECHHAKGKHPYASIMVDFYHRHLNKGSRELPRVFGMTASLVNSKGTTFSSKYQKHILELETLMNSKVYTTASEEVLAEYIPFPTPKIVLYDHAEIPFPMYTHLVSKLHILKHKYLVCVTDLDIDDDDKESVKRKITRLHGTFVYCLSELGVWLAQKAAETFSIEEKNNCFWGPLRDVRGNKTVDRFCKDASNVFAKCLSTGHCVGHDLHEDICAGYLTTKVECLIRSLLNYRDLENLRCIIFVERVITAIVIKSFLCTVPQLALWEMSYLVGNHSGWHNQSRHEHLSIVESFRLGRINIIVSTQILEEGLDVQSCNLVIRFDPSPTVCSFIQSRGRARMQNSDYLLILKRDDSYTLSKVRNYSISGCMMRKEALELSSLPCSSLNGTADEEFYCVGKTGATVSLSSSIPLICFYCSRLPSDRYFKPTPRFKFDDQLNSCTLLLPMNCPLPSISVENVSSNIKQIVCLEACKKLHQCGALSDYLLPLVDMEDEIPTQKLGNSSSAEHHVYFPSQLVDSWSSFSVVGSYHSYRISLNNHLDISFRDIIFVVKEMLGSDFAKMNFDLDSEWGDVSVNVEYLGVLHLKPDEVMLARTFQTAVLSIIIHQKIEVLNMILEHIDQREEGLAVTYLILPGLDLCKHPYIDWKCIRSERFLQVDINLSAVHHCSARTCRRVLMKNGLVNSCVIKDSIIYTPHCKAVYLIADLNGVNGYSDLKLQSGEIVTYQKFYQTRHGIDLCYPEECFLSGQHIFHARNYLSRKVFKKKKDSNFHSVALPPELCQIVLSPVGVRTVFSFSFLPSIMYRIESLLLAARVLKLDNLLKHVTVPSVKVLEAITTKRCREKFSLESLETLGDSFLKYVATVHLYQNKKHHHEGILSIKRDQIVSNAALYDLACSKKLPGFVRTLQFDPKSWKIPGACHVFCIDNQLQSVDSKHVVSKGSRIIKSKVISDAVEALIGVSLTVEGERKTLLFLQWLGIDVKCGQDIPNSLPPLHKSELFVNVRALESILKYKFHNSSLLVEALAHGSFQLEGISRCYQLLEFLGDAVLDYLITTNMYQKYPGIAPGLLTDLRSASVNNDCYAHAAVKVGLNKHVLHASTELHRQIEFYIANIQSSSSSCTSYGWDAGSALPKVLGDVIESLAGAIFVDSGYNKEAVWQSMRPLLEPLVTPETIEYHPVRKLKEICARKLYECNYIKVIKDSLVSVTVEIVAGSNKICETKKAINKKTAKKLAAKAALENLRTLGLL